MVGSEHRRADRKQKVVGKSELVCVRGTVARLAARSRQAAAPQQAAQVIRGIDAVREPPVLLGRRCESFDGAHAAQQPDKFVEMGRYRAFFRAQLQAFLLLCRPWIVEVSNGASLDASHPVSGPTATKIDEVSFSPWKGVSQ